MGKSLAELKKELSHINAQIRAKRATTSTRFEIAKAKHRRRKASFASLVGRFREKGFTFTQAAKRASKEYKKLSR